MPMERHAYKNISCAYIIHLKGGGGDFFAYALEIVEVFWYV